MAEAAPPPAAQAPGLLLAIEGIDGSGKGTQSRHLEAALNAAGRRAVRIAFPRYDETFFGAEVRRFLQGGYGELAAVPPQLAALLYAGDRFESLGLLTDLLAQGAVVICDRFTASNAAHQGARLPLAEREAFLQWQERLEFGVYGLPRPALNVFLDMPPAVSIALARARAAGAQQDLQERDGAYQEAVHECYNQLMARDPAHWLAIPCAQPGADGGAPRPRAEAEIAADLAAALRARLALPLS